MKSSFTILLVIFSVLALLSGCGRDSERASATRNNVEFNIQAPTVEAFKAKELKDGTISYYSQMVKFKGKEAEFIIYPNDDGTPLNNIQKENFCKRYRLFEQKVETALADFPQQIRPICRNYSLNVARLTDNDLRNGLNWQNIKIMQDNTIECYTNHEKVSKSLDIVLQFSNSMRLESVHFDG